MAASSRLAQTKKTTPVAIKKYKPLSVAITDDYAAEADIAEIRRLGVEIYRGPATTPSVLRTANTVCGTVAIWTK